MQTKQVDWDGFLARVIQSRHLPDEPSAATIQAEDERQRLRRRQRDQRTKNRALWREHYRTVADRLRRRADALERKARELDTGYGGLLVMARCSGHKPNGSRCTVLVNTDGSLCYWHDPDQAAARKRNAARGGRGSRTKEARDIRVQLRQLAADVVSGELERDKGTAAGQLLNYALRALQVERQLLETEELERRIEEMERDMGRGA